MSQSFLIILNLVQGKLLFTVASSSLKGLIIVLYDYTFLNHLRHKVRSLLAKICLLLHLLDLSLQLTESRLTGSEFVFFSQLFLFILLNLLFRSSSL